MGKWLSPGTWVGWFAIIVIAILYGVAMFVPNGMIRKVLLWAAAIIAAIWAYNETIGGKG